MKWQENQKPQKRDFKQSENNFKCPVEKRID